MAAVPAQSTGFTSYDDPVRAVEALQEIYTKNLAVLQNAFSGIVSGQQPADSVRAFYPEARVETATHYSVDSRLSYGHLPDPGHYATTITRPNLFAGYLEEQFRLLIRNHKVPIQIGTSDMPIPIHFAFPDGMNIEGISNANIDRPFRDIFDVPNLAYMDDSIVNGTVEFAEGKVRPLAPFTAPRVDYSLFRLAHYTATDPEHFQNFVLFTNYQFYVEAFCDWAKAELADPSSPYSSFVEPGNRITQKGESGPSGARAPERMPQMPAYHLKLGKNNGITMVNIGVGPSNAKTITDHIAVLRPHVWLMLGHCAGLRNTQRLGDYVLAHAYVRDDQVLDADVPIWVPIPPLAEVQVALERAVAAVTGLEGYELKKVMRTGTVASIDNRNWELRDHREPVERFSQSRAIALDMESATIAANGFRFRVPYGTLLCVSDKPLHGELKLPGMASDFYKTQVNQHLEVGIKALEALRGLGSERLHSRKLRSFMETAFQ